MYSASKLRKLIKMLEAETDKEKIDETIQKINSLIIKKGAVRIGGIAYLNPLAIESHICRKDEFEKGYFNCEVWGYNWGYPVRSDCIYIQPDNAGMDIVLSVNEQYAVSCHIKSAYICIHSSGINAPEANEKQIAEFIKKLGFYRNQYSGYSFIMG